ncbi:hypothetical protein BRAS3843_1130006 [Bradyrhizobium sp. STM 3843]|uniref:hypothetical protein n=1 Tax=Bradyrhizobium sp. STM 3843 TaxID=551947 RepID=UPI00024066AB|nr:hypothetical protein [Bradyrhizobium sp. STM 3843]CCE04775.1 hypothetical protein BRAS3843_1130006 [Bradyrhizobium sp. STM 3843]
MSDYAATRFVSLDDLAKGPMRATIVEVTMGDFDKPVATLSNGYKTDLNRSVMRELVEAYGDGDGTNFVGKEIELYLGEVKPKGKPPTPAKAIRTISPPVSAAVAAASAAAAKSEPKPQPKGSGMDDDIPF